MRWGVDRNINVVNLLISALLWILMRNIIVRQEHSISPFAVPGREKKKSGCGNVSLGIDVGVGSAIYVVTGHLSNHLCHGAVVYSRLKAMMFAVPTEGSLLFLTGVIGGGVARNSLSLQHLSRESQADDV